MPFDIPVRKTPPLDSRSIASKDGLMRIRPSLDSNSISNDAFRQIAYSSAPVRPVAPAPVAPTPVRPVAPAPVTPAPVKPAPVAPAPAIVTPAPMQSVPEAPKKKKRPLPAGNVFLQKGQKIPVDSSANIKIALGWDILDSRCELDASAFMLGADGKVLGDEWFIFYSQNTSPDKSVVYSVSQETDDAVIDIDFSKISPEVQKIVFSVTIYEAVKKNLNFGMTENIYSRMLDGNGNEIFRFALDECYSNVTAMVLGELYRYKGAWKFNAVGSGVARDLEGFCAMYGVNLI